MRKSVISKIFTLVFSAVFIKVLGFVFRVYLSKTAGAEGCGLYHLVLSVYAFGASISSLGISQTLSRLVSYNEKYSKRILRTALTLTVAVSFIVSFSVYNFSEYIAVEFLKDSRVISSLKAISFCFPAIAVFSSVSGYFNGLSKVKYAANGQITEQITRILFVLVFLKKALESGLESGIFVMSLGIVLGEYISMLYIFISYKIYSGNKKDSFIKKYFLKDILKISLPIASGGYISSFIHTLENILLPVKLSTYGWSNSQSVSALGLVKGMATPVIFLPTIIISSMCVLVLPKISKEDSKGNNGNIKNVAVKTLGLSFFVGALSVIIFLIYADKITLLIYGNQESSVYVKAMSLSLPFLFFNMNSNSILNGLGMQIITMAENIFIGVVKLTAVVTLVPKLGINGYFIGFVVSEIIGFIIYFILIYNIVFIKNVQNKKKS